MTENTALTGVDSTGSAGPDALERVSRRLRADAADDHSPVFAASAIV
jgi:hypothetical protein